MCISPRRYRVGITRSAVFIVVITLRVMYLSPRRMRVGITRSVMTTLKTVPPGRRHLLLCWQAVFGPGAPAAIHADDVGVTHLLKRIGRES